MYEILRDVYVLDEMICFDQFFLTFSSISLRYSTCMLYDFVLLIIVSLIDKLRFGQRYRYISSVRNMGRSYFGRDDLF